MSTTSRSRTKAEERFAKLTKRELEQRKDREKALKASEQKVARLKALRLAKEAEDIEAAEEGRPGKKRTSGKAGTQDRGAPTPGSAD